MTSLTLSTAAAESTRRRVLLLFLVSEDGVVGFDYILILIRAATHTVCRNTMMGEAGCETSRLHSCHERRSELEQRSRSSRKLTIVQLFFFIIVQNVIRYPVKQSYEAAVQ